MINHTYSLFTVELHPVFIQLHNKILDQMVDRYTGWLKKNYGNNFVSGDDSSIHGVEFLTFMIAETITRLDHSRSAYNAYLKNYTNAANRDEREHHILVFAKQLGADKTQLKGDRKAFERWFDHDAVIERYQKQSKSAEQKLSFLINRFGVLSAVALNRSLNNKKDRSIKRLNPEMTLQSLLHYYGDPRVVIETIRAFISWVRALPEEHKKEEGINENILLFIYRASLDESQNTWIQCEALRLVSIISKISFTKKAKKRIAHPSKTHPDDLFVRKCIIDIAGEHAAEDADLLSIVLKALDDPSDYVRQAIPRALKKNSFQHVQLIFEKILFKDTSPQVRATALLELCSHLKEPEDIETIACFLTRVFTSEQNSFVIKVALKVSFDGLKMLIEEKRNESAKIWYDLLTDKITELVLKKDDIPIKRWAAKTMEKMWCHFDLKRRQLEASLLPLIKGIKPGKHKRISRRFRKEAGINDFARVLSVIAQEDYGLVIKTGIFFDTIYRGHQFRFRWWRFLHELLHASPEKRQAYDHTRGRIFRGSIHIPSSIMGEVTETKVPGEPLHYALEGGCREYLPLVDEVISSLQQGVTKNTMCIYTSEGMTQVKIPFDPVRRLWAVMNLTFRFNRLSSLRNWQEGTHTSPKAYLRSLKKIGIKTCFIPYEKRPNKNSVDPDVTRFFPAIFSFTSNKFWIKFSDYFFSVYENTLFELSLFILILTAIFFIVHFIRYRTIKYWRKKIPLVIGGWGTRGKSGVERLKSAVFSSLGYSVFTKTTGCEALFLFSSRFNTLKEFFLFRPYDKASIWEQHDAIQMAGKLGADIMLWECMALNPSYVHILQQEWMKDDYSTITNTMPDHEDIMGPAGINIPQEMTNFIPSGGKFFTSEEVMLPILKNDAIRKKTEITTTGWLEAGLLTDDILARFPYEEHPYNIALVTTLMTEFGLKEEYTVKEMADSVLPDIGVLKNYPAATIEGRTVVFTNGMSANERYGCLSNWQRTGFDQRSHEENPGEFISTLVNNRADRIARSHIFAKILVNDISADKHFLIGTNLKDMKIFIHTALEERLINIRLDTQSGENFTPEDILKQETVKNRLCSSEKQVNDKLKAMLSPFLPQEKINSILSHEDIIDALHQEIKENSSKSIHSIIRFHTENVEAFQDYTNLLNAINSQVSISEINSTFHDFIRKWFLKKLVFINNPRITGNQIISIIVKETPPGTLNKIMGLQNIKNTGMDFVYRWQDWETCYHACNQAGSDKISEVEQGLEKLLSFPSFGLLDIEYLEKALNKAKNNPLLQEEKHQTKIKALFEKLSLSKKTDGNSVNNEDEKKFMTKVLGIVQAFLEPGDSIRRRKKTNQIYRDLVNERISSVRAIQELGSIKKREVEGWL